MEPRDVFLLRKDMKSQRVIINWINNMLSCNLNCIRDLRSGAIYCQIMHRICPKSIPISKICLYSYLEAEFASNFKLLQGAFGKLCIRREVPVVELQAGRGHYEFSNWMYKFYHMLGKLMPYDALEARRFSAIGIDHSPIPWDERRSVSILDRNLFASGESPLEPNTESEHADEPLGSVYEKETIESYSEDEEVQMSIDTDKRILRRQVGLKAARLEEIIRIIQLSPSPDDAIKEMRILLKLTEDKNPPPHTEKKVSWQKKPAQYLSLEELTKLCSSKIRTDLAKSEEEPIAFAQIKTDGGDNMSKSQKSLDDEVYAALQS